jgi:predicted Fe-S protein YdhL (DUF1289 family)
MQCGAGTLSRIGNWAEMSDVEKANTQRVIAKRNQQRMDLLKKQGIDTVGGAKMPTQ